MRTGLSPSVNRLFSPVTLPAPTGPGLVVRNRAFIAPMCQYSVQAEDGIPTDWHLVHLGAFAQGGFGLVTAEATAVEARGRISPQDLGLWGDAQIEAHRRITDFLHAQGASAAVQLAHAGGKASTAPALPGHQNGSLSAEDGGWETVAPNAEAIIPGLAVPHALTTAELAEVVQAFADAAVRADAAGYDVIQLHGAHGYLLHQFLSPLTNHRTDAYGGSEENRTRLLRDVVDAVRAVWPEHKPLGLRLSGTDWIEGGWDVEASARIVDELVAHHGLNWVDVSSGGVVRADGTVTIPVGPAYQTALAARVRAVLDTGVGQGKQAVVSAVGLIEEADQAETILALGAADAVSVGRAALRDPHWAASAAKQLHVPAAENPRAPQFARGGW